MEFYRYFCLKSLPRIVILLGSFAVLFSGCSGKKDQPSPSSASAPSDFTPISQNTPIATTTYTINSKDCVGLDLSQSRLTPRTFRTLLYCLNLNGSLEPYQNWLSRVSDQTLEPLLAALDSGLVQNKKRLFEIDRSFEQLKKSGRVDPVLENLSGFLANDDLVGSMSRYLKQNVLTSDKKIDLQFLESLESVSAEIGRVDANPFGQKNVAKEKQAFHKTVRSLEHFYFISASEKYQSFVRGLAKPIPSSRLGLRLLSDYSHRYFKSKLNVKTPYLKMLLWGFADGSIFKSFDHFMSLHSSEWGRESAYHQQVLALSKVFRTFAAPENEKWVIRLSNIFRTLDRKLDCLDGELYIPNINMYVMRSWKDLSPKDAPLIVSRNNMLEMKLSSSVCDYPPQINELASYLWELSTTFPEELTLSAEFIQALAAGGKNPPLPASKKDLVGDYASSDRYLFLLNDFLSDPSEHRFSTTLVHSMAEITDPKRYFWDNLLYVIDGLDRDAVSSFLQVFLKADQNLGDTSSWEDEIKNKKNTTATGGKSVVDIWVKLFENSTSDSFFEILKAFRTLTETREEKSFARFALALREAALFNESHPLFDFVYELTLKATKNEKVFRSLLEILSLPESDQAMKHTYALSKKGELSELLRGVLLMLGGKQKAQWAEPKLNASFKAIPQMKFNPKKIAHQKSLPAVEKLVWKKRSYSAPEVNACQGLDFTIGLDVIESPSWAKQLQVFGACLNHNNEFADVTKLIQIGTTHRLATGEPLFSYLTAHGKKLLGLTDLSFRKNALEQVSKVFRNSNLVQGAKNLKPLFNMKHCISFSSCKQSVFPVEAVQSLAKDLVVEKKSVEELLGLVSSLIKDPALPRSLGLTYDLSRFSKSVKWPMLRPLPDLSPDIVDELKAKISKYETGGSSPDSLTQEKIWDYWNQILTWQKKQEYGSPDKFKKALRPMLDELSNPNRKVLENSLSFFLKMHGSPYTPEWMAGWLKRLSSNIKAIPYYYPGKFPGVDSPTVRLVSQLDLLELIVLDADFTLREIGQMAGAISIFGQKIGEDPDENFAMRYLTGLAHAGPHLTAWVDHLHSDMDSYYNLMFPAPPTSSGSVWGKIKIQVDKTKDSIIVPELKRRIFNLKQVAHVVRELNYPLDSMARNDLSVLRDLFNAVHQATPQEYQNTHRKDVNSLSFVVEMVRFGLLRNITSSMWFVDRDGSTKAIDATPVFDLLARAAVTRRNGKLELNPDLLSMFDFILRKNTPIHGKLPLHVLNFDQRYKLIGAVVDYFYRLMEHDEKKNGESTLARSLYEASNVLSLLAKKVEKSSYDKAYLIENILIVAKPWILGEKGHELFLHKINDFEEVLTSKSNVLFLEFLGQSATNESFMKGRTFTEANGFESLASLVNRTVKDLGQGDRSEKLMHALYRLYFNSSEKGLSKTEAVFSSVFEQFEKNSEADFTKDVIDFIVDATPYSEKLRGNVAEYLASNDPLFLIDFLAKEENLSKQVEFLGEDQTIHQLEEFLEKVQKGLKSR